LGKRKVLSEANLKELVMPEQGEILGRVIRLTGGDQVVLGWSLNPLLLFFVLPKLAKVPKPQSNQ
jgi:hypothetical protein